MWGGKVTTRDVVKGKVSTRANVKGGVSSKGSVKGRPFALGVPGKPVVEPLEVTENGTYTPPVEIDGYSSVTVNVPLKYDEGYSVGKQEGYDEGYSDGYQASQDSIILQEKTISAELTEQEELIATLRDTLKGKAVGGVPAALIRSGIGYIDTGIDAANSNIKIEIRYEFITMPSGYFYIIRAYVNESTNATRILYNKNTAVYNCLNSIPSKSLTSSVTKYANVVYTDILKPESSTRFSYTTNGEKVDTTRTSGATIEGKNLLLFNDSASSDNVSVKVYYLKIYDGETLVRDYVPYIAKSGECGLYDLVTKQFYGNDGDGTFEVETMEVIADE